MHPNKQGIRNQHGLKDAAAATRETELFERLFVALLITLSRRASTLFMLSENPLQPSQGTSLRDDDVQADAPMKIIWVVASVSTRIGEESERAARELANK